jgi:hypothetical protein
MRPRSVNTWFVIALCSAVNMVIAAEQTAAPFTIPPDGKPELLIGQVDLEAPTALAFDARNRPYMFEACNPEHFGYILTLRDGQWVKLSYIEALTKLYPNMQRPTKQNKHAPGTIAVTDRGDVYALVRVVKRPGRTGTALLFSGDGGKSFQAFDIPGFAFLEIQTGHNSTSVPPAIGVIAKRKDHPARWTAYHNLKVYLPTRSEQGLTLGEPLLVSSDCFGVSNHSGGYSFAATIGSKTHVVYANIAPDSKGNPTYIATIDRKQRHVTAAKQLADAHPTKPDVHSTPVVAPGPDSKLHVLTGAHNGPFYYLQSSEPNAHNGAWREPMAQGQKQTYATLVCDKDGKLHTVYRKHPKLLYVSRDADSARWSEPRVLVTAPKGHKGYTIFYHRLFIDRSSTLYLSFSFFEFHTGQAGRYPRALAYSKDGGKTWRLATTASMRSNIKPTAAKRR